MRKDRWFCGALLKQRLNVFTAAALTAAVLVGAAFVLAPQPAEAGGALCAAEFDALVEATVEVRLACGREVWTDECRVATNNWFDAMDDYIDCLGVPVF